MRILWCGIGPWHKTAYGQQTALFAPRLAGLLGHEVVISLFGVTGDPKQAGKDPYRHPEAKETQRTGLWRGLRVIGPGRSEFAAADPGVIREAFGGHDPDLMITLKDPFVLPPADYKRDWPCAVWANVDCTPLSRLDRLFFTYSGAKPIATSKFGRNQFKAAGFDAPLVPHAVDLSVFGPPASKADARAKLGLPEDAFIAGINAMNVGTVSRKAFYEQMAGFSQYTERGRVPGCYLLMHTNRQHPEGIDLGSIAKHLGIEKQVMFGAGTNMTALDMLSWYQSLDVLLAASYGEGFGVPIVEALACGVPVIGSRNSAITEKISKGCGWLVGCQDWWHPEFEAVWGIPRTGEIAACLGRAAGRPSVPPGAANAWDADHVTVQYWKPALDVLAGA